MTNQINAQPSQSTASAEAPHAGNNNIRTFVTVGKEVQFSKTHAPRDISLVMQAIRTGNAQGCDLGCNLEQRIGKLRKMTDKKAQKQAKQSLPWFCGSVIRKGCPRSNANVEQAFYMIFDVDHVPDPEGTKQLAITRLPFVLYAFASPLDGVKLVAALSQPITVEQEYRQVYRYLASQIEDKLALPCDATSDWSRACFFSYDPSLLTNFLCLPVDPAKVLKTLERKVEQTAPLLPKTATSQSDSSKVSDYARAEQIIAIMSQITISYRDWIKLGQALYAGFGEAGKPLWDMFLNNPNYHDSQRTLNTHWRSFASVRSITLASLFYIAEQYGVKL